MRLPLLAAVAALAAGPAFAADSYENNSQASAEAVGAGGHLSEAGVKTASAVVALPLAVGGFSVEQGGQSVAMTGGSVTHAGGGISEAGYKAGNLPIMASGSAVQSAGASAQGAGGLVQAVGDETVNGGKAAMTFANAPLSVTDTVIVAPQPAPQVPYDAKAPK